MADVKESVKWCPYDGRYRFDGGLSSDCSLQAPPRSQKPFGLSRNRGTTPSCHWPPNELHGDGLSSSQAEVGISLVVLYATTSTSINVEV